MHCTKEKEPKRKEYIIFFFTTFIGLRERGSEGIACPKGVMRSSGGYPKLFIGLSVASLFRGKFADDCFLLVGFTIHPLLRHPIFACRVTLSISQHVPRLRLLPAVEFLSEAKETFVCSSFSLIPSAVQSLGEIKKKMDRNRVGQLIRSIFGSEVLSHRKAFHIVALDAGTKLQRLKIMCNRTEIAVVNIR